MRTKRKQISRIVLAYTGGLETSAAIPWLSETYGAQVITVTLDVGQGRELAHIRDRALAAGAVRAHVFDLREELASEFVLRALQAGAMQDGRDPLSSPLSRPLIAKQLVAVAHIEETLAIAHGCGADNADRVRLEASARALDPTLTILAPAAAWGFSRSELVEYARQHDIPVPAAIEDPYIVDANIWGRSATFLSPDGAAADWSEPSEDLFPLTRPAAETPDTPAYVEIEFDRGTPIKINGVPMPAAELIQSLETIAGAHGVGRIDMIGRDVNGRASRQMLEAPAAIALHAAHRALQAFATPRELDRIASEMAGKYVDLVLDGTWFSAVREAIDAFVANVQQRVTGVVRLKLHKGACHVAGVHADRSTAARPLTHGPIASLPH